MTDQLGRMTSSSTTGIANYEYSYNDISQIIQENINLSSENGGLNRQIVRSYDNFGRPTGYQLKNGEQVEQNIHYTYNSVGQLMTVNADGKEFTYSYVQNAPQLIESMTSPVHTVTNTYEAQRDVLVNKSNTWKNKVDNPIISSYIYSVNNLGQRVSVETAGEAFGATPAPWTWNYDVLGQVISANNDNYSYDSIGNRKTSGKNNEVLENYQSNSLNQYVNIANTTPNYDLDGNLLTGLLPTISNPNRASLSFTYNAENRPISVSQNSEILEEYAYDFMGRRVRKGNSIIIYDGYNAIAEYNLNSKALVLTNAWGLDLSGTMQGAGGVGGLLSVTDYTSQTSLVSYPTYDGNGNISEYLTEVDNGSISAHYEYDAFGNVNKKTGDKDYQYQFSTKPYDKTTGLSYYNYRLYDSISARWINRDPIQEQGGLNLYAMLGNDVIYKVDFLGKKATEKDCAKCNEYIAKKQRDYANVILRLRGKCDISFMCKDMNGRWSGFAYFPKPAPGEHENRHIVVDIDCCAGAKELDKNSEDDTFAHELTHVLDYCLGIDVMSNCASIVCAEIRAYSAGRCKGLSGPALYQCLLFGLETSAKPQEKCKGFDIEQVLEEQFKKCYSVDPLNLSVFL